MKLSVVIPTHNRAETLRKCIEHVGRQRGVSLELIVVDDGSIDHTEQVVREFDGVKYLKQPASHQGIARNMGAKIATGDVIVFIGDDIFMQQGFLKKHHDRHIRHHAENVVVLGHTTWDPSLEINDYMRFLESSGWQFGYDFIKPGFVEQDDSYKFFYTSNISIKKTFFEKERFNENFRVYGWEDIELGYRLKKHHNMLLYYEPSAKAFHHHPMKEIDLASRMRRVGASAVHFEKLQPEVHVIPHGIKGMAIRAATNPITVPLSRMFGINTYYKFRSWQEFLNGTKV